jgi:hypothetical protein
MEKDEQERLVRSLYVVQEELWPLRRQMPNCLYLLETVKSYAIKGHDAPEWLREAVEKALREKGSQAAMAPEEKPKIGYGAYSAQMERCLGGHAIYRRPDGSEVEVTVTSQSPNFPSTKWPDLEFRGEVLCHGYVRTVVTDRLTHESNTMSHRDAWKWERASEL